jgi:FHS family glucose/mannose:H+ symporter-like MFS transporter
MEHERLSETYVVKSREESLAASRSVLTITLIATIGMAAHGFAMTLTGAVLPQIMQTFAIRETAAGVILAAGAFGFMSGSLLGAFVIDDFGTKPVLLAAWSTVIVSLAAIGVVQAYLLMVIASFGLGLGSGLLETSLNVLPTQIGGGAGLMNIVHMGYGIGALSAPLLAGALIAAGHSWRLPFWLTASVPLLLAARSLTAPLPAAPKIAATETERQPVWSLLRQPMVILGATALLFYVAAELGVSSWIVVFSLKRLHLPQFMASVSLSLFWGFILIGRLGQGLLARWLTLPSLIVGGAVLFALALLGVGLSSSGELGLAFLALAGLGASGIFPNIMAHTNRLYPRQIGVITGTLATLACAGSCAVQPVMGWVAEHYGLSTGLLGLSGCMAVVALAYLPVLLGKVKPSQV